MSKPFNSVLILQAANHEVLTHHLLRTWSLNAIQQGSQGRGVVADALDETPPPSRMRSSASVGATPSGEMMEWDTFLTINERMHEDFQTETEPSRSVY